MESSNPDPVSVNSQTILKNIHDAVYMLDSDGRISWVNEVAFGEFNTGYSREELIGSPVSKILSDEDIEKCTRIISDLLEDDNRDSDRCDISLQTANGGEIPCDLRLALLPSENGEFEGSIGVLRDVTERKRREQGLTVLHRVLRHNLRNRLNVIIGQAEALRQEELAGDERIEAVLETAHQLERLGSKARQVGNVLTDENWQRDTIDAPALIETLSDQFQRRYPAADFRPSVPETAMVQADGRLSIALEQLLENAVEHADQSTPVVEIEVEAVSADRVEIRVIDDGPGIPSNERRAIMSGEETPLEHGTGLGLWTVKWVVERCHGEFELAEHPDGGTLAVIRLNRSSA